MFVCVSERLSECVCVKKLTLYIATEGQNKYVCIYSIFAQYFTVNIRRPYKRGKNESV